MKTWKRKVNMPKFGICEVKEMTDRECSKYHDLQPWQYKDVKKRGRVLYTIKRFCYSPSSQGFVNLFQNGIYMGWCGINYAKERVID